MTFGFRAGMAVENPKNAFREITLWRVGHLPFSKALMKGQGKPARRVRASGTFLMIALALGLSGGAALAAERVTPSGLPVPRYVSLKFASVNARAGPGDDYRALWVYHARGLPVQVLAETTEWRRICDPEGNMAWVHMRTTDGRRTVMRTQSGPTPFHSAPKPDAPIRAQLQNRAIASLVKCTAKGWCRLRVDGVSGWVQPSQVWGLDDKPQCNPGLAPRPAR